MTIYVTCIACGYDGLPYWKTRERDMDSYNYTICPKCGSSQVKERFKP